jgi:hypothetical protein
MRVMGWEQLSLAFTEDFSAYLSNRHATLEGWFSEPVTIWNSKRISPPSKGTVGLGCLLPYASGVNNRTGMKQGGHQKQQVAEKRLLFRLIKNVQMPGTRNSEK